MDTLTWTTQPTASPSVTLDLGQFATPVTAVSLELTSLSDPYTTFLMAFNPAGQQVSFCMEYAGAGYTYQGGQLVGANCMTQVSPNTFQFKAAGDISEVMTGTYMAAGPPTDVTYASVAPQELAAHVSVPEPSTLWLVGAWLVGYALARYPARRFRT